MIATLLVFAVSLMAAALTLYSGFGLGTLLLPVFALFFPLEAAVAATAVVHGANNLFKLAAVGGHADRAVVLRFGIPAIMAAFVGAGVLGLVATQPPVFTWHLLGREAVITPIKAIIAAMMGGFALFELLPRLKALRFDRRYLPLGGALSGFFGGLSGHQGALRAAFLTKANLSAEAFVGTNAVIGFLVDAARLTVYAVAFLLLGLGTPLTAAEAPLILIGIAGALAGVILSTRYLRKVSMAAIQTLVGVLLLALAVLLGLGLL